MSGLVWRSMRGQRFKFLLFFMIAVLFLWILLTTFSSSDSHVEPPRPPVQKESEKKAPYVSSDNRGEEKVEKQQKTDFNKADLDKDRTEKKNETAVDTSPVEPPRPATQNKNEQKPSSAPSDNCNGCRTVIDKVLMHFSQNWTKQEVNYQKFRSELKTKCNGMDKAIVTQANTPVGSKLVYDGERKRVREVNSELFRTFVKESPFSNKTWDTCAVVGNSGILTDSGCGNEIDSAQFVIRCNLPPVEDGFKTHVGSKTEMVTANPTILLQKYGALSGHRRPFVESLHKYGNSMLLLPAFSFGMNTLVCLRALYTIEDFGVPIQPVFFNPEYLQNVGGFWRTQGLRAIRPSTGLMMVSLALEICSNVHLYGFWPFSNHPHGFQPLTNHYYDTKPPKRGFHSMPVEFDLLLQLHSQGVLKVHLGQCGKQ